MKKNKLLKIGLLISIILITTIILISINEKTSNLILASELLRSQAYEEVESGDENIEDETGNVLTAVKFDAFFLRDKDGDGITEPIRGTCNQIGSQANMYMELSVLEEGYVKNGTITINSNNFYFNTAIVKDNEVQTNYISSNTKEIKLNDINNGTQKLLIGSVRSGDYSSSSSKTSAIGNNTSKYSMENSVTFSGTFVDSNGNETPFTKIVPFMVDWHGELNCDITPKSQTITKDDMGTLVTEEGLTLNFNITTTENKNQLIMESSNISGTIPELNGYKPTSVKISGTNVTYTYDEETGNFTAQRTAVVNENGVVTSNAYTSSNSSTKYNSYNFTIIYPIESYQEMGEDVTSLELSIPIKAVNKGYNNPNEEDGFVNPYISNTAEGIIVTTWKKQIQVEQTYSPKFDIYVGTYMRTPYNTYVISKKKPINIYNGISLEEINDTYLVQWKAYTGTNGITDGIIMNETTGKTDSFLNTSSTNISMEELTTNKGIYFSGATETLGTNGWIKIFDAETNALIKTFTSSDWNNYTASNPYNYENKVKHIRVETSSTNASSYFYVNNIKELDDTYITENYTREEFDNLAYIYSYLDGYMIEPTEEPTNEVSYWYKTSAYNKALYEAPTSIAQIAIKENTISTHTTAENELITISAVTTQYNTQGWKNGTFLVQLPSEIILAEINSVTTNNENVKISAYDIYEEEGYFYIKILTENENEETFNIVIDCDLTPDPRISKTTKQVKLYAINENACDYYYSGADEYDIDGDSNKTEQINYREALLSLDPGSSLSTVQIGSNYGEEGAITIAPRVAKIDKDQRNATITVSATNNYSYDIQDIKILGVIPFEGNKYVISGQDLGSTYTTNMTEGGIKTLTTDIADYVTIYYSTYEKPNENLDDKTNGWTLAENVTDWSTIKTYLITLDSSYELATGEKIEFEYEISLPKGVDYNEVSYSEHAIYFALATEEGLYYTSTGSAKLGFMIAKQYDLEIVKYQQDTEKTLQGITFTVTEDGADTSTIKVTDENGVIVVSGLYVERYYTIKEEKTTEDYVLNDEEIRFYTYTEINEDGTESLYLTYPNNENTRALPEQTYSSVQDEMIFGANASKGEDYKIQIKIENEVKSKLAITKTDKQTGEPLRNIKFTLTGQGKDGEILTTDKNGKINISGLYLDSEYTLQEVKATGYYIPQTPIKFTITNNNGTFNLNYTDNGTTKTKEIIVQDEIPTISLDLENEKIPTYGLQLTKYAKGEKDTNGNDKTLQRAQYIIYGEGISESGKVYTTDENGVLTIDNLYEFVNGKYITGEYTLTEIYAPEGYSLNSTSLKFKTYRENGTLKIQILEGEDVIRTITNETTGEAEKDLNITNASNEYPVIQIGVEDSQIFTLFKYYKDGTTSKKVPIPGTKFMITDLDGNYVTSSDGEIIGELDESGKYLVTTDENGLITANLPEGLYKAVEIYTPNRYYLEEKEEDRTYYFGIGASQAQSSDWVNGITGKGWNYINSVEATDDRGVIAVGSFSDYSIIEGAEDGIDLNKDGIIDEVSLGNNDGIIISYDVDGNYAWSKSFGGDDDDSLNKIIQTSDGGYVAVGYVSSINVEYDGTEIAELSKSDTETNLGNKDGVILKLDSDGNYEWGIRLGGIADDEIKSVIQTSENNFVIAGSYYSSTFNLFETSSTEIKDSFENRGNRDAFIASYSETGKYQWNQRISGTYNIEAVDLIEYPSGLAVAVNAIGSIYTSTSATSTINSGSTAYQNGMVLGYKLDGTYSWYKEIGNSSSYNNEITSITTQADGTMIAGINSGASGVQYDAKIYKITSTGTSATSTLIYTLTGTYDEYVSSVTPTSDGGILFGGWYYSTDTTGDGGLTFAEKSGEYASDGYVIKLDSSGQVVYSSRLYGDNYDGVTSVTETKNGSLVSGGYFNSSTFSATNCEIARDEGDETIDKELMLTRVGNSEGFVISEGATGAEVPEAQSLEIENKIKAFKITTQVIKNSDVFGGEIDGETDVTYDGVEYTKDGIRYIETVGHGENSTKAIKITPDANYVIAYITINNEQYTNFTIAEDGTVTIPIFEQVTKDIHIAVEFSNTLSNLEVNHYLWTTENGTTTQRVDQSEYYTGDVGGSYTVLPKTDIDYEIITNGDYYGSELPDGLIAEDYYIPANYTGTYQEGTKIIVNYYYKEKTYTLTVHHYLEGTNEAVPLKGSTTGEKVEDEITDGYAKGSQYTTTQLTDDLIDYSIYDLVEIPINANGTIEENTEVTYYYKIKEVGFNFTKVAEENHSVTISNTEFKLYQFVGVKDELAQDEMIDIKNVSSDWKLVDTYTSSSTGNVKLQGLPITSEYRLVETKSADGRLIPEGQWKIEFIYKDYDTNDTSIIKVNETPIKITAIGNPPALVLTEGGEILLPNKQYYKFPASGGIGSNDFFKMGIVIITLGIVLLFIGEFTLRKKKNKSKAKHKNSY